MEVLSKEQVSMFRKCFNAAKRRASKKEISFSIDLNDVFDLFSKQEGKCYYSGITMNVVKNSDQLHDPMKMTLDCKDSKIGYIKSNIVMCTYCVNSFKQRMTEKEMKDICRKIITNDDTKN